MLTTEHWAIVGQAFVLCLAGVGAFAIGWYVGRVR